jgi:hypothetical protein
LAPRPIASYSAGAPHPVERIRPVCGGTDGLAPAAKVAGMTVQGLPTSYENVPRGTILALLILPVGIAVWLLIWSFGFIASIVAFLIALGGMFLYRLGAGRMSVAGAVRVAMITVVTLLIALVAGFAADVAFVFASEFGIPPLDALALPGFWPITFEYMFGEGLMSTLAALGFGALGCFSVLRAGFAEAKRNDALLTGPVGGPSAPVAETVIMPSSTSVASTVPPAEAPAAGSTETETETAVPDEARPSA